jgi:hypothetical protein
LVKGQIVGKKTARGLLLICYLKHYDMLLKNKNRDEAKSLKSSRGGWINRISYRSEVQNLGFMFLPGIEVLI